MKPPTYQEYRAELKQEMARIVEAAEHARKVRERRERERRR